MRAARPKVDGTLTTASCAREYVRAKYRYEANADAGLPMQGFRGMEPEALQRWRGDGGVAGEAGGGRRAGGRPFIGAVGRPRPTAPN